MSKRVLVIIPAYNEEATIRAVLRALRDQAPDYDVLVVDDGSLDHTAKLVLEEGHAHLVSLPYNLGIGAGMQTGYKYADRHGYDVAIQCDADGQHPVEQIRDLVDRLDRGDLDLVIGSRYVADTGYEPSLSRRVGKSILSRVVDRAIGGGITDTTSGFRAANHKTIRIFARHYPDDYPEAESLVLLHMYGLRAGEIPVTMRRRQGGVTSIGARDGAYYMVKVGLAILIDLFRNYAKRTEDASNA